MQARTKCSVLKVFNELYLGVEEDVKTINSAPPMEQHPSMSFGIRTNTMGDYFVVFQTENATNRVDFNCEAGCIIARNRNDRKFRITLTLNNEGRCKLRVDGGEEELEFWQVRRMVLEDLFFTSSYPTAQPQPSQPPSSAAQPSW